MPVRGVRGATVAESNQPKAILLAARELLQAILELNPLMHTNDLASAFFTTTDDLNAAYPAEAARQLGWDSVPLMCACEIAVPGSLQSCIRVLLHWNTDLPQEQIRHVYLGAAQTLRPDLPGVIDSKKKKTLMFFDRRNRYDDYYAYRRLKKRDRCRCGEGENQRVDCPCFHR